MSGELISKEPPESAVAHMLNDENELSNSAAKERDTVAMSRVKPIKQDISELSSHLSPSTYHNNKKT